MKVFLTPETKQKNMKYVINMDDLTNFYKNIKTLRLKKNLSQKELGNILGVSNFVVSKWEIGEGQVDSVIGFLLDRNFGITIKDMIQMEDISELLDKAEN